MKKTILPVTLLFFVIAGGIFITTMGWSAFWASLRIPTMSPPFADMRTVQGAIKSIEIGLNPQQENPGDPWGRAMNYPKIWIAIGQLLKLDNETSFIAFNISAIAILYLVYAIMLYRYPYIPSLAMILSPAALLAVERGNNDIIIFSLVFISCTRIQWLSTLSIVSAIALKLYPMALIPITITIKRYIAATIITVSAIALLYINHLDLEKIASGNTANGDLSFGLVSAATLLASHLGPQAFKLDTLVYPMVIIFGVLLSRKADLINKATELGKNDPLALNLYLSGSAIYFFTYCASQNWDYRLIFLTLTLPCIYLLRKDPMAKFMTLLMFLSMSYLWGGSLKYWFIISGYAKLLLFSIIAEQLAAFFYQKMKFIFSEELQRQQTHG